MVVVDVADIPSFAQAAYEHDYALLTSPLLTPKDARYVHVLDCSAVTVTAAAATLPHSKPHRDSMFHFSDSGSFKCTALTHTGRLV